MAKVKWKVVPDNHVRHIWQCENEECPHSDCAEISPDWYQSNGTHVCCECDEDMVYIRTEVRQ